jgi:SpoVK/Ycf46/Vps4 family AAA+-type ATPase
MADLNNLTKLFQAIAERDWAAADDIARRVASGEERIGHHAAAQRLRGALNPNGHLGGAREGEAGSQLEPSNSAQFLTSALTAVTADRGLADLQLRGKTVEELKEVIAEWAHRDQLAARGLVRRNKLLFHGPPGCGKSVTARAIGRELGMPVYVVRFDAVVGAYLGQTALHLRQLFRFAEATPSVLLVDEIDALGKRRGNPLDVGELDRVVIALLQELEHSRPAGLLIATSNLARQLDDALWRRFDSVVEFPAPQRHELRSFINDLGKRRHLTLSRRARSALSRAKTYADAERLIEAEERRLVLKSR